MSLRVWITLSGRKYRQDGIYRKIKKHKKTALELRGFFTI